MKEVYKIGNFSIADTYYFVNDVTTNISIFYKSFAILLNSTLQALFYALFLMFTDLSIFLYFIIGALIIAFPSSYLLKKGKEYQHITFYEGRSLNYTFQRIIENLFLIKDNVIYTPPVQDCVLKGITASSVITIAKNLGYEVQYKSLIRDELFLADELFFTGTAAEVTPIREVDERIIGNGKRGPVTEKIQTEFFDIVHGKKSDYSNWLTLAK